MSENPELRGEPPDPGVNLVKMGTQMAGGLVGIALGQLFGSPDAAFAGAMIAPPAASALRVVANELGSRVLSLWEKERVGSALAFAVERFRERTGAGDQVRDDAFFEEQPNGRKAAHQVAEGVLQAARRAFEERKVRHLGYMFANIGFEPGIDRSLAAQVIDDAESLTWRQYLLLAAVGAKNAVQLPQASLSTDPQNWNAFGLLAEFNDLFKRGCVTSTPTKTLRLGLQYPNLQMDELRLGRRGQLLAALMSLDMVPDEDLDAIRQEISDAVRSASAPAAPSTEDREDPG